MSEVNKSRTLSQRIEMMRSPIASRLLQIMQEKTTNLAVAADVTTKSELLDLAEKIGPEICMLKTHADIIIDWDSNTGKKLMEVAKRHNFMIFEDRKFADIGNTVVNQVCGGVHQIAQWADIVNAHPVPGPGIVKGLRKASESLDTGKSFGLILLAEMSSQGNFATGLPDYTQRTIEMADADNDFVFGFISMGKIAGDDYIYMTPGVRMASGGDQLGQQYATPDRVIREQGSDIIIVGRGIYRADNPVEAAKRYRAAGWKAYEEKVGVH